MEIAKCDWYDGQIDSIKKRIGNTLSLEDHRQLVSDIDTLMLDACLDMNQLVRETVSGYKYGENTRDRFYQFLKALQITLGQIRPNPDPLLSR